MGLKCTCNLEQVDGSQLIDENAAMVTRVCLTEDVIECRRKSVTQVRRDGEIRNKGSK